MFKVLNSFCTLLVILMVTATVHADVVKVIDSPKDAIQIRVDLIQQAKSYVNIQYYEFVNDEVARFLQAVIRQAAQGSPGRDPVTVRLLVDNYQNSMSPGVAKALADAHVQIKVYHPFSLLKLSQAHRRMHDKDIIVDGKKLLTGGRNVANDYYGIGGTAFIDRDVYAEGESAQAADSYFMSLWNSKEVEPLKIPQMPTDVKTLAECNQIDDQQEAQQCRKDSKLAQDISEAPGALDAMVENPPKEIPVKFFTNKDWAAGERDVPVRYLHDMPGAEDNTHGVYGDVVALMKTADDSITIETPFLVPSSDMMEVLKSLTNPNRPSLDPARPPHAVKVRILTNSLMSAGPQGIMAQTGYESIKQQLLDMKIDLWETKSTFIHAKSFVIDGKTAIIGSFNMDVRSQRLNSEVALVIFDEQVAKDLSASMESHLLESYQLDRIGFPMTDDHRFPNVKQGVVTKMRIFQALLIPFLRDQL